MEADFYTNIYLADRSKVPFVKNKPIKDTSLTVMYKADVFEKMETNIDI